MAKSAYDTWTRQTHKTYAQYLAESKPITKNQASIDAQPKMTKGDSHRYRHRLKKMKQKGEIFERDLPIRKDGIIKIKQYKEMTKGEKDDRS